MKTNSQPFYDEETDDTKVKKLIRNYINKFFRIALTEICLLHNDGCQRLDLAYKKIQSSIHEKVMKPDTVFDQFLTAYLNNLRTLNSETVALEVMWPRVEFLIQQDSETLLPSLNTYSKQLVELLAGVSLEAIYLINRDLMEMKHFVSRMAKLGVSFATGVGVSTLAELEKKKDINKMIVIKGYLSQLKTILKHVMSLPEVKQATSGFLVSKTGGGTKFKRRRKRMSKKKFNKPTASAMKE